WQRLRAAGRLRFRWIDGHRCFAAARDLGASFARVALLREPLRRLVSVFHWRALVHPSELPFDDLEALLDAGEARRWSLAEGLLQLAGDGDAATLSDAELYARASEQLDREYALVGIAERFAETVFAVADLLGWDSVGMGASVLATPKLFALDDLTSRVRR